jgi:hypothetical protein
MHNSDITRKINLIRKYILRFHYKIVFPLNFDTFSLAHAYNKFPCYDQKHKGDNAHLRMQHQVSLNILSATKVLTIEILNIRNKMRVSFENKMFYISNFVACLKNSGMAKIKCF